MRYNTDRQLNKLTNKINKQNEYFIKEIETFEKNQISEIQLTIWGKN